MSTPRPHDAPAWEEFWSGIDGEDWLTAKKLIELSPALLASCSQWLRYRDVGRDRTADLDLAGWVADVDESGRGWSTYEFKLYEVVACILEPDRQVSLYRLLDYLGDWTEPVWAALVAWGSGGNNRDRQGKLAVIPNR